MKSKKSHIRFEAALIAIVVSIAVLQVGRAYTQERITIYPTGVFPTDVENIQTAVDALGAVGADGVIILKARNADGAPTPFNFKDDGDPDERGSVVIAGNQAGAVAFHGESNQQVQTTILGGQIPFDMRRRNHLTIRDMTFQRAFLTAIAVQAATGVVIQDNRFIDTLGFTDRLFPLVRVLSLRGLASDANQITGQIIIQGNLIDTATASFSDAISALWTNAETWITQNHISGVNVGIRQNAYYQPVYILDNDLSVFVPGPDFFAGGTSIGCGFGEDSVALIADNHVTAVDETQAGFARGLQIADIHAFGADCAMMNAVVQDNVITMADGRAGIEILAALPGAQALRNVVIDNVVQGSSDYGLRLRGDPGASGSTDVQNAHNLIIDNNFTMLQAAEADILLDSFTSSNHVVIRIGDTVIDEGTNNEVSLDDGGDD